MEHGTLSDHLVRLHIEPEVYSPLYDLLSAPLGE